MEPAGLAVGFAGLAGLFGACVDCFKLIQLYQSRDDDYDHLQTMLDNQKFLFMAWGRACGFMDPETVDARFNEPLAITRNYQIEQTMKCIQDLFTDGDQLKRKYGMRTWHAGAKAAITRRPPLSAYERAFQGTKRFWNTSLQRRSYISGTIRWAVHDKEKFFDLVNNLRQFITDLRSFTNPLGFETPQNLIIEYEMELIDDEQSLDAISSANPPAEGDDIVSLAASRHLLRVQERSTAPSDLKPTDSVSILSSMKSTRATEVRETAREEITDDITQEIGIIRVPTARWRYVKMRQGFLPELPTLLVSQLDSMDRSAQDGDSGVVDLDFLGQSNPFRTEAPTRHELDDPSVVPDRLAINSPTLLGTLNKISGVRLSENQNVLIYPFKLLLYHEEEIRKALTAAERKLELGIAEPLGQHSSGLNNGATPTSSTSTNTNKDVLLRVRDELKTLVEVMDTDMREIFDLQKRIASRTLLEISYNQLCLLFSPGDVIISNSNQISSLRAYRVLSITGGRKILDPENHSGIDVPSDTKPCETTKVNQAVQGYIESSEASTFVIDCFYLDYDGTEVGPRPQRFVIPKYVNKLSVAFLPIYPIEYTSSIISEKLQQRGACFIDAIKRRALHYRGNTLSELDVEHSASCQHCAQKDTIELLDSDVIIDYNSTVEHLRETGCTWKIVFGGGVLWKPTNPDRRETFETLNCSKQTCTRCSDVFDDSVLEIQRRSKFMSSTSLLTRGWIDWTNTTEYAIIERNIAELLPFRLCGYAFMTRRCLDRLILPAGHKEIIQALVAKHMGASSDSDTSFQDLSGDLVRDTHQRLTILLHGAPGVGKTLTAEAIAKQLKRPLFPVTCGDIWSTTKDVEKSLESIFSLAERWNCVLLVDEADVFLASRNDKDLERSSLMSTFSRQVEYFTGILILTTIRIGYFDEAFLSRMHVTLYFPRLTPQAAIKLWRTYLDLLQDTNARNAKSLIPCTKQIMEFAKQLHKNERGASRWNGRQIRNAFQTAMALAKWEQSGANDAASETPVYLRVEHFERVVSASKEFDDYMRQTLEIEDVSLSAFRNDTLETPSPQVKNDATASSVTLSNDGDSTDDDSIRELELKLELAKLRKKRKLKGQKLRQSPEESGGSESE